MTHDRRSGRYARRRPELNSRTADLMHLSLFVPSLLLARTRSVLPMLLPARKCCSILIWILFSYFIFVVSGLTTGANDPAVVYSPAQAWSDEYCVDSGPLPAIPSSSFNTWVCGARYYPSNTLLSTQQNVSFIVTGGYIYL